MDVKREPSVVGRTVALGLVVGLFFSGCGKDGHNNGGAVRGETVAGKFVDCKQDPHGSVEATVDTLTQSIVNIGDAEAGPDIQPKWREEVTVEAQGLGKLAVTADGFGPLMNYQDIVDGAESSELFHNTKTGSRVTVSAPHTDDPAKSAPVIVTFHC